MCQRLLRSASFYAHLCRIDAEIAEDYRGRGCGFCGGGRLHVANYARKPRGGPPAGLEWEYSSRLSFCCGGGGGRECRRRTTPPSVRFLGRRVYLGVVVILVTTMMHGLTPKRMATLSRELDVSPETVARWRRWWREEFPQTSVWAALRGTLMPAVGRWRLPQGILEGLRGTEEERLICFLKHLGPLTVSWASVVS